VERVTVLIGGDVCPCGPTEDLFRRGDARAIFGDLLPAFESADVAVVNLECPLTGEPSPIEKAGSLFRADPSCVNGLSSAGIDAVNLANNHILDHGPKGLRRTLESCRAAGIRCFGAGENLAEAGSPLVFDVRGSRVALLAVAEHEFSTAGETTCGANPLDLIDFCHFVEAHRGDYDSLIVLVHGGAEHYRYPSPRLQKTCRFLVEQGASAVICQHSHCPGTYETHHGAPIVYGQGNLVFHEPNHDVDYYRGFLVKLTLRPGEAGPAMEIVPYFQCYQQLGTRLMSPSEDQAFREEIVSRSRVLSDHAEVKRLWRDFCASQRDVYLAMSLGYGRLLRRVNRRFGFARFLFSRRRLLLLLHLVRCESHQEALQTILEEVPRKLD